MFDVNLIIQAEKNLGEYAACQWTWVKHWRKEGQLKYAERADLRLRRAAKARKALRSFLVDVFPEHVNEDGTPKTGGETV